MIKKFTFSGLDVTVTNDTLLQGRLMQVEDSIVQMWIQSLKDGSYKQTQESLRLWDSFCCLGVLCDITQEASDSPYKWSSQSGKNWYFKGANFQGDLTPPKWWFNLNWKFTVNGKTRRARNFIDFLTTLNDENEFTFPQIAEVIETLVKEI